MLLLVSNLLFLITMLLLVSNLLFSITMLLLVSNLVLYHFTKLSIVDYCSVSCAIL